MVVLETLSRLTWVEWLGWVVAALAISGSAMRTIIPLRCLGIATNIFGIVFTASAGIHSGLAVHLILLPINILRLVEMLRLVAKVKRAASSDLSMEWLKPFMARERLKAGQVLFCRGDTAQCLFYTLSGLYRLRELGIDLPPGQVVGEMGFLSPENRRTQTLECVEEGEVLTITYEQLRELYFQNPEFGFYFLRLTSERLFQNMTRLEAELAALKGSAPTATDRAA